MKEPTNDKNVSLCKKQIYLKQINCKESQADLFNNIYRAKHTNGYEFCVLSRMKIKIQALEMKYLSRVQGTLTRE